ncbi:cholinesterase-like [Spea bombifrons]|uniref:cholinesterase-like n=1 Tax=Spea bombifrons TaxID=233779 RepID=UPI00234B2884|nr:cholinesterase-like [Spea bombifrons]
MWQDLLKVWLVVGFLVVHTGADDTIVSTKQGEVSGKKVSVLSGSVTAYLGIPYGEPPTGTQRFKKPQPRKPWDGVLKATEFGNSCFQIKEDEYFNFPGIEMWIVNNEMSEDCLYLNVWVPSPKPKHAAVMVFIYGGAFITGTTSLDIYDGSVLAYAENVIVVSMNYRLGALGFLALPGNKNAPGNAGLFDQRLALQWVHENIESFGGNPDGITIFGHSAGAASVGYHVISAGSHNFFSRAIIQSGSATAYWAISSHERARKLTLKEAELLGCPLEDDDALIECLQKQDPKDLTDKQLSVETQYALTLFTPVLDSDFISENPDILVEKTLKQGDILIGITKDDGNPCTVFGAPGFSAKNESLVTLAQLEEGLKFYLPSTGDLGIESILLQYVDWDDTDNLEKNRDAMELILRDYYFSCPIKQFVKHATGHGNKVFLYEYDYRFSSEVWPEWMGVVHGAELPLLFGKPLIDSTNFTNAERLLSKRIMTFWANFARDGSPTGDTEEFIWPQYSNKDEKYTILKRDHSEVHQKWFNRQCQFWNNFFPKLVEQLKSKP